MQGLFRLETTYDMSLFKNFFLLIALSNLDLHVVAGHQKLLTEHTVAVESAVA